MENILLIRLKSIGDVLFTLPAVNVIRDNYPRANIDFLTSRENASLLRGFREVNEIITIDRAALKTGNPLRMIREVATLLHRLRAKQYSLVVDFQGYGETELLAWWCQSSESWGAVSPRRRGWAYDRGVPRDESMQIADFNLHLLQRGGLKVREIRNEYFLPDEAVAAAKAFFSAHNLKLAVPTLFIQPLTSSPAKNWPLKHYLDLAKFWQAQGAQVIFGGGPAERPVLEPAHLAGFPVAAGTSLLVSGGLMQLSSVVVGGVTGLVHMAVAMGVRCVMLVGNPEGETGFPYRHHDWAVTPPPGQSLSEMDASLVAAAIERAFAERLTG